MILMQCIQSKAQQTSQFEVFATHSSFYFEASCTKVSYQATRISFNAYRIANF